LKTIVINLDSAEITLVSFDVFDTVITRKSGTPETIFRRTGEKLRDQGLLDIPPRAFEQMRAEAERRTRKHRPQREINLAEIYQEMNRLWFFPETKLRELMHRELETERENLYAIPGAVKLIEQARQAGKRIVFVSDMYLPKYFLREVLIEQHLMADGEGLYVSSEWGGSKAGGRLFPLLLQQEKLKGAQVLHLGDSLYCDVVRATEQGIQARQITRGSLNRFELALAKAEAELFERPGQLAGFARQARLNAQANGEYFVAARMGSSLAGPLLTAYAEWVLRTALKRQLRRLYFLARDGEVLMRLCEVLAPFVGAADIELKYLYGSRETWSPAAQLPMDEAAADFFARQIAWTASTWEHCVEYLGFTPAEINATSLQDKWGATVKNLEWKKQIFRDVAGNPVLGPKLRQRLGEKTALAARYMREQGLAEPVPSGLVDCGWSGTWTDLIGDLVETQGGRRPLVFFLGQRKRSSPARSETLAWMFDHERGSGLKTVPDFFHVVVEFLLTANHGRTIGFEERDGALHPKLAPVDWQGFAPASWKVFREALLAFAKNYAEDLKPNRESVDLRPTLNELVILSWEQPTVEEAQFLAGHTIGLSPSRTNTNGLARAYRWPDGLRLSFRGQLPGYPPFWWHEGALALSKPKIRKTMAFLWRGWQLLRALRDNGCGGLAAKRLVRLLGASARKLNQELDSREENSACCFVTAPAQTVIPPRTPRAVSARPAEKTKS